MPCVAITPPSAAPASIARRDGVPVILVSSRPCLAAG